MTSDVDADSVRRHNEQFAHKEPSVPTESAAVLPTLESFPEAVRKAVPNCSMVRLRDKGVQIAAFPSALSFMPSCISLGTCVKRLVSSSSVSPTLQSSPDALDLPQMRCRDRWESAPGVCPCDAGMQFPAFHPRCLSRRCSFASAVCSCRLNSELFCNLTHAEKLYQRRCGY